MSKIIFFIFFLFFSAEVFPQDTLVPKKEQLVQYDTDSEVIPMELNEETLENYKNDTSFQYVELKHQETWWDNFKNWLGELWHQFWTWLFGDYEANGFTAFLVRIIPYLILFGIFIFIGWLFYKLNPGSYFLKSKDTPELFFTEEEEIIKSKNIKELIEKAVEKQDYRLAVRYYYLLILKKLTDAELIEYEFDKTNNDYISEITSEGITTQFRKATTLYDYIWYGSFDVTETDFRKAQHTFTYLEQKIPNAVD